MRFLWDPTVINSAFSLSSTQMFQKSQPEVTFDIGLDSPTFTTLKIFGAFMLTNIQVEVGFYLILTTLFLYTSNQ